MAYIRLNGGDGAFRPTDYDKESNDIFAYSASALLIKPSPKLDYERDMKKGLIDVPETGTEAVYTRLFNDFDLGNINEYGYSFWIRYLTMYPVPMKR